MTWVLVRLNGLGYIGTGIGAAGFGDGDLEPQSNQKEASQLHDGGEARNSAVRRGRTHETV